jgi:putative FmdB family regulatory protein
MPVKIFDYQCAECNYIFESITFNDEEVTSMQCPLCHHIAIKVLSSPAIAHYKSGFKPTPLLEDTGKELNTKKKDIFGRRFDDLPDNLAKESRYHKKIEELQKEKKRKATLEEQMNTIDNVFGRNTIIKEEG